MTEVALQAVGLVRRIEGGSGSHTLVNGIDLAVKKGEFLAITGPSGSGKSSLLYLLGLLDAPSEGEVIVCGQPTSKLSESDRADVRLTKCGFVFQFHFLLPEFTSLDNVLLPHSFEHARVPPEHFFGSYDRKAVFVGGLENRDGMAAASFRGVDVACAQGEFGAK